jgi:uncharacterized protein
MVKANHGVNRSAKSSPARRVPRAPGIVNTDTFTRLEKKVEGRVEPASLSRLREALFSPDGEINYRIEGRVVTGPDGSRQPRLQCTIKGWVTLQCQATLKALRHDLNNYSRMILVAREEELPPLEEEAENENYIVAGPELDLTALLEDEVILNLPMIPRGADGSPETSLENGGTAGTETSPFAALAALKKQNL